MVLIRKLYLLLFTTLGIITLFKGVESNTRLPIVAIVSMPNPSGQNYVSSNYVRWLEASGADSVVIHPWQSEEEIDLILTKVNGVLLQSVDAPFNYTNSYIQLVERILMKSIALVDKEKQMPIFAVCHGLQTLHFIIGGDVVANFTLDNVSKSLNFNVDYVKSSKMFARFEDTDLNALANSPTTFHSHKHGVDPAVYDTYERLRNFFRITTTGKDINNKDFIASVEAKEYPIYAVQFRPEVVVFNRNEKLNVNNEIEAVRISRAIGNFFVSETRNNKNEMKLEEYAKYNYIDPYKSFPSMIDGNYYFVYEMPKERL